MNADVTSSEGGPARVQELEQAFGGPSQAAFGTAVFFEPATNDHAGRDLKSLEQRALARYQHFCGKTWEKFGPDNWLGTWQSVHTRATDAAPIIDALASIEDRQARRSAATMLEGHGDPEEAKRALQQVFDDPAVEELQIFRIGDGSAMSGILIAAQGSAAGSVFLTFLLD